MPKTKTKKSATKRFRLTGSGKIMRAKVGRSHLLKKKSASRKRRLRKKEAVVSGEARDIKRMITGG